MSGYSFDDLKMRLKQREATVGVIGLGYVGLPLCLAFAEAGCQVLGFDIDPDKPKSINAGRSYLKQFASERIAELVEKKRLSGTANMDRLSEPDALFICVPTPLTKHLAPNLTYVEQTVRAIAKQLRPGQLVVLESTTYPGTTEEVVRPILEETGLVVGQDIWLAFSPEREDPGNATHTTTTIPKVVGADDEESLTLAEAAYQIFGSQTVRVSTSATAEAVKITENIFRAVNIALVNELKIVYNKMGINIWEVVDAAKTKPFGYMPFYPGPGLGGHCIPIDPFYLTWKAKEYGLSTRFVELAGQINTDMPGYVVSELAKALDQRFRKGLNNSKILILGVAYKKNIEDIRESPSLKLIEMLEARGALCDFYDPHINQIGETRDHPTLNRRFGVPWNLEKFASYDAALIATDHDGVDYEGLCRSVLLVVDTRNACASVSSGNVVTA